MGLVICMASVKGGSGKTVLSATFGAVLAAAGKKVLLVDTDAATNGLSLLYLDETLTARAVAEDRGDPPIIGVYELGDYEDVDYGLVPLPTGVWLLPATVGFFNTEAASSERYATQLSIALGAWRDAFDYIVLDAQAGSDIYAAISMASADRVVIVSEYDPLSAAGVERLKALYPVELSYERTWVLLNKMLPELVQSYSDFMEVARYLRPVPWDAAVVRAYSRRSLALDLRFGNEHTAAVIGTLRSLLPPAQEEELKRWVGERAAEIREPLDVQARDLEAQILGLDQLVERRLLFRSRILRYSLAGMGLILASAAALALTISIDLLGITQLLLVMVTLGSLFLTSRSDNGAVLRLEVQRQRLNEDLEQIRGLGELESQELFARGSSLSDGRES
jgi:cellulose biosynthesis protein BcsQ